MISAVITMPGSSRRNERLCGCGLVVARGVARFGGRRAEGLDDEWLRGGGAAGGAAEGSVAGEAGSGSVSRATGSGGVGGSGSLPGTWTPRGADGREPSSVVIVSV